MKKSPLVQAGADTETKNNISPSAPASVANRLPLNTVIGDRELCAWQVAPGVTWVQTRSPQFARKLSQRQDSRLVVRGVAGGYLRTFEFRHGLAWARRLITRYTQTEMATNAPLNSLRPPARAVFQQEVSAEATV